MKLLSQKSKKLWIRIIFIFPFFTCLITCLGIRYFTMHTTKMYVEDSEKMFIAISAVLFINAIMSFLSLVSYYCLENKVDYITEKKKKKHEKAKSKI